MLWDASWMELISDSEVADSLEGNVQMLVNKGLHPHVHADHRARHR